MKLNNDLLDDIYSTTETRIGTWIDGKPIYRKVIKVYNTIAFYSLNPPANVNTFVKLEVMQQDSDGSYIPSYFWNSTDYLRIFKTSNGIQIRTSKPDNSFTHWVVIEYTKTID